MEPKTERESEKNVSKDDQKLLPEELSEKEESELELCDECEGTPCYW